MSGLNLLPVFMVGLLGGVHCVGMCGGIVGAFSAAAPARKPFPVAVAAHDGHAVAGSAAFALSYNAGRLASYMAAGAVAGSVAGGVRVLAGVSQIQTGAYWLANLMLVAIGLYLMDAWKGVAYVETAGRGIWRRLQPLMRHVLPADTPARAFALGGLWGWVPCGMVYSMLATAMLSGSAVDGAAVMLAFGLGTLPWLLALGMAGAEVRSWARHRSVRVVGGTVVVAFGVAGIMRALHGLPHWSGWLCVGTVS